MRGPYVLLGLVYVFLISATASASRAGIFQRMYCSLTEWLAKSECCLHARVDFRYEDFKNTLQRRLHGQPMAAKWLASAVRNHWDNNYQPDKALVMTLHGPPGTGKTFITEILADYTFQLGSKSSFYHLFHATVHFPYKEESVTYANQIRSWVRGNVSNCGKSLFVFDEIDKMPVSVLDSLKSFVDYNSRVDGVDFRRSIFIFLSNIGDHLLVRDLAKWKRLNKSRNTFPIEKQDRQLSDYAFSDAKSSLKDSELLKHRLISHFIPFLPLEREHLVQCINDYLSRIQRYEFIGDWKFIRSVLDKIQFVPEVEKFFASTGCKRIGDKVNEAIEVLRWERESESGEIALKSRKARNDL